MKVWVRTLYRDNGNVYARNEPVEESTFQSITGLLADFKAMPFDERFIYFKSSDTDKFRVLIHMERLNGA